MRTAPSQDLASKQSAASSAGAFDIVCVQGCDAAHLRDTGEPAYGVPKWIGIRLFFLQPPQALVDGTTVAMLGVLAVFS